MRVAVSSAINPLNVHHLSEFINCGASLQTEPSCLMRFKWLKIDRLTKTCLRHSDVIILLSLIALCQGAYVPCHGIVQTKRIPQ